MLVLHDSVSAALKLAAAAHCGSRRLTRHLQKLVMTVRVLSPLIICFV